MAKTHTVQRGETIVDIAMKNGFRTWETVWQHAANDALRKQRQNPHVLAPGDTLFIEAEILKVKRSIGVARARCVVNGEVVSEAELMFSLMDR